MGIQISASAGRADDIGALTNNTGVVSDDVLENVAATTSPADAAPTSTALGCGAVGCDSSHPSKASVDTALSTLQTRINALSTKATIDARVQSLENNCSDLAAAINDLRTNLRTVRLMK